MPVRNPSLIDVKDEGISQGRVTALDFTGSAVVASVSGFVGTINVTGGAAVVEIKQTEIDFGAMPVSEASFLIADTDVDATSQLIGSVAYEAPTGKDLDELEMDGLDLKFGPGVDQFTLYARGMDGYIADKFKINYLIG